MDPRQLRIVLSIGLGALSFIAFGPVLYADFLAWDDTLNIVEVPEIRGLGGENLRWMFFDFGPDIRYKPITYLAWAIIHAIGGMKPFLFHLANLVMHTVNGCLLIFVLNRLGNLAVGAPQQKSVENWRWQSAAVVALIWTVHPLRVETSAWVSVLSYSLAVFFLLLAMLAFLGCDHEQSLFKQGRYWGSLGLFQLGMMSFPTAIGFSFAFLAVSIFPLRRRQLWLPSLPFFALTAIMVAVGLYGQHVKQGIWGDPISLEELPLGTRVLGSFYFLAYYGWRPFYPFKMFTLNEDLVGMKASDPHVMAAIVIVAGSAGWIWMKRKSSPALLAVYVAFVGITFPVLKLTGGTPFPGPGDRYSLIPGLAWIAGIYGLVMLLREHRHRNRILAGLALIAVVFTIQSRSRSQVWENDVTFFTDQVHTLKGNVYRGQAYARLAKALFAEEQYDAGLAACEEAWQLVPPVAASQIGAVQGQTLLNLGRRGEALVVLQRARQLLPGDGAILQWLATTYFAFGDRVNGMQVINELIGIHRDDPTSYFVAANTLASFGEFEAALVVTERGLQRIPVSEPLQQLRQQIQQAR
ncbi:MAG: tetratricopeptide repeat protein [Limisphaerales bacterium]